MPAPLNDGAVWGTDTFRRCVLLCVCSAFKYVSFFKKMPESMRRFALAKMKLVRVPANTLVFKEGDPAHHAFLILQGAVALHERRLAVPAPPLLVLVQLVLQVLQLPCSAGEPGSHALVVA